MRIPVLVLAVGVALNGAAPVHAQKKSPAELLPANVMAYAEIHSPGELAQEIRDLFKGSCIYDVPDSMIPLQKKHPKANFVAMEVFKSCGLMIAPEVVDEIKKGKGAAVALLSLGAGKHGPEPEWVAIIQPGTSNAPKLLMRAVMSLAPVKVTDTVEGVNVYQTVAWSKTAGPDGKGEVKEHEGPIAFAKMPGYLFVGSLGGVKQCIERAHDKGKGDTLAKSKDFASAYKKVGGEPGLFIYAKTSSLMAALEDFAKQGPPDAGQIMQAYKKLVNPSAIRSFAISMTLQKGTMHLQEMILLNPKEKSPLLDTYPTKAVDTGLLHFAPKDSVLAVAVSNADGAKRWDKLIKAADDILPAKLIGGQSVSEHIKSFEKETGLDFANLIGKTTNIGFALGNPFTAPFVVTKTVGPDFETESGFPQVPMVLILEAADENAAKDLTAAIAKIARAVTNKDLEPKTKTIMGHKVTTLAMKPNYELAYGIVGNAVVVGPYAAGVAQALADGADKKGLASDENVMKQIKGFKEPLAISLYKPMSFAFATFGVSGYSTGKGKTTNKAPGDKIDPNQPKDTKTTVEIKKDTPEQAKMKKELQPLLELEPWLVAGVTRGEDYILEEGKSSGWEKFVPKAVDFAAEKSLEYFALGKPATEKPPIDKKSEPPDSPKPDKQADPSAKKVDGKIMLDITGELTKKDTVQDGFYQKVHDVELTAGKKYTIDVVAAKDKFFDTYLIVKDAKGKVLTEKDDGGDGLNARLVFQPKQTGMYRLVVTSFKEGETGRYTLTVTE